MGKCQITKKTLSEVKPRKLYLDMMRLLAISFVIFNHSSVNGYMLFTVARESEFYYLYMALSIIAKNGVPLFLMISGALLLKKNEKWDAIFRRFIKYTVILVICSFVTYVWSWKRFQYYDSFSLIYFLKTLYTSNLATAYWYLYAYLAIILMLPLLRSMAQGMREIDFQMIFLISISMSLIGIVEYLISGGAGAHNSSFNIVLLTNIVFYPLIGYYLENRLDLNKVSGKMIVLMILSFTLSVMFSCYMTQYHCNHIGEWKEATCQRFMASFTQIQSVSIFLLIKTIFNRHNVSGLLQVVISEIGACTFGVYLFERIWRHETYAVFLFFHKYLHTLTSCLLWVISAFLLGALCTFLFKQVIFRIKYIRKKDRLI